MNTINVRVPHVINRLPKRKADQLRQAAARRRLQELRDEKVLQSWLTEVWYESPSLIEIDPSRKFYDRPFGEITSTTDKDLISAEERH